MHSRSEFLNCLIVEDDRFKSDSISALVREYFGNRVRITTSQALIPALSALEEQVFDIAIIDMSIPSHPTSQGAGSPYSFPTGGLDVLFEIDQLGWDCCCVILTQYTDIEIEGVLVSLGDATVEIQKKFGIQVSACIQYFEDQPEWKRAIREVFESL